MGRVEQQRGRATTAAPPLLLIRPTLLTLFPSLRRTPSCGKKFLLFIFTSPETCERVSNCYRRGGSGGSEEGAVPLAVPNVTTDVGHTADAADAAAGKGRAEAEDSPRGCRRVRVRRRCGRCGGGEGGRGGGGGGGEGGGGGGPNVFEYQSTGFLIAHHVFHSHGHLGHEVLQIDVCDDEVLHGADKAAHGLVEVNVRGRTDTGSGRVCVFVSREEKMRSSARTCRGPVWGSLRCVMAWMNI